MAETGLLGYQGLRERLAIDGKLPCLRKVKALAKKHRAILRPVELGYRSVGFRPARVEALLSYLAGDQQIGGRKL